jgi:O-antigen ligase
VTISIPNAVPLPAPLRAAFGAASIRRTTLLLSIALAAGPFWVVVGPALEWVTVGRALLGLTLLSLLIDLIQGDARFRITPRAALLLASIFGLLAWVAVSVRTDGCNCSGGFAGLTEFALTAFVTVAVATVDPDRRGLLLGSAIAGVLLGGLVAALPVGDLSETVADQTLGNNRLGGVYGNPNFLAFALAFSIPVLALWTWSSRGWRRTALAGLLVASGALILLTYSRSGALAALVGLTTVAICLVRTMRRRIALATGAAVAIAALAVLANSFYEEERSSAPAGVADRSGWDPKAQGPIPKGASGLSNDGEWLAASARAGEGASIPIGPASPSARYRVSFELSASRPVAMAYALEDNFQGNGIVLRETGAAPIPRTIRLGWRPTAESKNARFYVFSPNQPADFAIRDVTVTERPQGGVASTTQLSTKLLGPARTNADVEQRYVEARRQGVELALDAFASDPLTGIGWERFPAYAEEHGDYGAVPTHDEYVRFAAELGIVGLLPLLAATVLALIGLREIRDDGLRWALIGVIATGAFGLLFVNGLERASGAIPLAAALGICWAGEAAFRARGRSSGSHREEPLVGDLGMPDLELEKDPDLQ